jgi:hypothetical protein
MTGSAKRRPPGAFGTVAATCLLLVAACAVAGEEAGRSQVWVPPPLVTLEPGEQLPAAAELEQRGARIGKVLVRVYDIFDLADPRENNALYRTANLLHIETRESTVLEQLTFAPGEPLKVHRLQESERLLRERKYIFDAVVRPARYYPDSNTVDIEVSIRDVWTLNPGISFGRKGGENAYGLELEEQNLLGLGTDVQIAYDDNVDRESYSFRYTDPNIARSRWSGTVQLADNSDGYARGLTLLRPFYSLDATWSVMLRTLDDDRIHSRYDLGEIVDQFRQQETLLDAYYGWSHGLRDAWTRRWRVGVRYDDARFERPASDLQPRELPPDHKFVYPWIGFELIQDAYDEGSNQDQIGRTEDLYFGRMLHLELGFAGSSLGSSADAAMLSGWYQSGTRLSDRRRFALSAAFSGRIESDGIADGVLTAEGRFYQNVGRRQVFYASLQGMVVENLDPEKQLLLGGDSGLRGYPLRFQTGTSRALLTLEQRLYTDWYPFRLFNIGAAAFFDAGRTWGRGPVGEPPLGLLKDLGLGLRIGNSRSGLGSVIHVDFSYALDAPPDVTKFQITIETKKSF